MQKLYAYVDESGPDTTGRLFLVSVVVTGEDRNALLAELARIEKASRKGARKWHGSGHKARFAYIRAVTTNPCFQGLVFVSHYPGSGAYLSLTVYTTAQAILQKASGEYSVIVTVDGLSGDREVRRFAKRLRRLHIHVEKVRGAREESEAFIRLADACCGLVRDAIEGKLAAQELYHQAKTRGVIKELQ